MPAWHQTGSRAIDAVHWRVYGSAHARLIACAVCGDCGLCAVRASDESWLGLERRSGRWCRGRALAAFLNTDGGTLLVGVKDDRTVTGIEADYPYVGGSPDGWCRTFDTVSSNALGTNAQSRVDLQMEPWEGHTIAVVRCPPPGQDATWIGNDLFVRHTAWTEKLSAKDAVEWCNQRFGS